MNTDLTKSAGFRTLLQGSYMTSEGVARKLRESAGELTCGRCRGQRMVDARLYHSDHLEWSRELRRNKTGDWLRSLVNAGPGAPPTPDSAKLPLPWITLAKVRCRQCSESWALLLVSETPDPDQDHVVVLGGGGFPRLSPHVPANVMELVDEVAKCLGAGAYAASLAMLRSAVEAVLYEQGYTVGMLGRKVKALERDLDQNAAPIWTHALGPDAIRVLKDLGNWVLHTDDFALRSSAVNRELAAKAVTLLVGLLEVVYELPAKREGTVKELNLAIPPRGKELPPGEDASRAPDHNEPTRRA